MLVLADAAIESVPVTLGDILLIFSVFTASGIAVWRISSVVSGLKTRLEDLEKDQFGMSQAAELALRQAIANPDMRVPDPRKPNELIQVFDEDEGASR